jgi:hypothetical protein
MDRHDVRVRKSGGGARFAQESLTRLGGVGEVGWQDLDGDVAVELHIAGEVDDPHAPAPQLPLERVLAGEGFLQLQKLGRGDCQVLYSTKLPRDTQGQRPFQAGFRFSTNALVPSA